MDQSGVDLDEGTARVIPAQLVRLAMGFMGPEPEIVKQFELESDARSKVKADHGSFTAHLPGVFAACECDNY